MSAVSPLLAFVLRQVVVDEHEAAEFVANHVTLGQALYDALDRANERAWQVLAMTLNGAPFVKAIEGFLKDPKAKDIAKTVSALLESLTPMLSGINDAQRSACAAELLKARQRGILTLKKVDVPQLAQKTAAFHRFAERQKLIDAAVAAQAQLADELLPSCPALARLLKQAANNAPPLLVAAVAYFFWYDIEMSDAWCSMLPLESLRQLAAAQTRSFLEIARVLAAIDAQFDSLLQACSPPEPVVVASRSASTAAAAPPKKVNLSDEVLDLLPPPSLPHDAGPTPDNAARIKNFLDRVRQLVPRITQPKERNEPYRVLTRLQAQLHDIGGAKASADAILDPHEQTWAYRSVVEEMLKQKNMAEARRFVDLARRASTRIVDKTWRGFADRDICGLLAAIGELKTANELAATIDYDASREEAHSEIAKALANIGDYNGARNVCRRISDAWRRSSAHYSISAALAKAGDIAGAKDAVKSISDQFYIDLSYSCIVRAQAKARDFKGARATADLMQTQNLCASARESLARSLLKAGDNAGAVEALRQAGSHAVRITQLYSRAQAFAEIASIYVKLGKLDTARDLVQQAKAIVPKIDDDFWRNYTWRDVISAQVMTGDLSGAQANLSKIGDVSQRGYAYDTIGRALIKAGSVDQAIQWIERISSVREQAQAWLGAAAALFPEEED